MTRRFRRFAFPVIALAIAVAGLIQLRGEDTRRVLTVDDTLGDPGRLQGEHVRVRGTVQAISRLTPADNEWRIALGSQARRLTARYRGAVPSTFIPGAEVVIGGKWDGTELAAEDVLVRVPD